MGTDTSNKPHPAETRFLEAAQKAMGRPLSEDEAKCVDGYGVLAEMMLPQYKGQQDFEKLFAERRALIESVHALENLGSGPESPLDSWKHFVQTLDEPLR